MASGIAILVTGVLLGIMHRARRRDRGAFRQLAEALGGELQGLEFVVPRGTAEFRCTFDPGSRRRAPSLRVLLPADSSLTFIVSRKGGWSRALSRMGHRARLETGDAEFDREVSVRTDEPEEVLAFLADPKRRASIRRLLGERWSYLTFHPGSIQVVRTPLSPERDMDPLHLRDTFHRMEEVARELPAMAVGDRWLHLERMRHSAVPTFLAALILLLLGAVLLWGWGWIAYSPIRPYRMYASTLPVTGLFFLPIALWMADRLSADMHTLGRSMYLVVFLFLSVFVYGGAMILNGALDREAPRVHENLAVSFIDRGAFPAKVRVESWDGTGERTIRVGNAEARRLAERNPWRLTVAAQPGAFGYEWVAWARVE